MIRIAVGAIVGYLFSLATSLAWFVGTHHNPVKPVSTKYLTASCITGALCSVIAGFLAAAIGQTRRSAFGTAIILFAFGGVGVAESFVVKQSGSLELTWVSIIVMVPATIAGGLLWKRSQQTS